MAKLWPLLERAATGKRTAYDCRHRTMQRTQKEMNGDTPIQSITIYI